MPKVAVELGPLAVSRLRTEGFYPVGAVPGLALSVSKTGARSWVLRIRTPAGRRELGLGSFPAVTLAAARERARELRDAVRLGIDPLAEKRAARSAARAAAAGDQTFKQCAEAFIETHAAGWKNAKHAQQWTNTLAQHAYPVIGELAVRDVRLPQVLAVLGPMWHTTTETASRVRGRIEQVLDWATVRGLRTGDNPARWRGHLDKVLPKPRKVSKVEHHAALPIDDAPAFMARLRAAAGTAARALEFLVITAARSGEVRDMTWRDLDLKARLWTVPAERMKARREHRVPLSLEALALLENLPQGKPDELVFLAPRGGRLSDMTLSAVLRRLKVSAVPHGFRSTFRDWAAERTSYPRDLAEMALAHAIGAKVEAAYRQDDMFDRRAEMMQVWAQYLGHER